IDYFKMLTDDKDKSEISKKSLLRLAEANFEKAKYRKSAEAYERFLAEYQDSNEVKSAKYKLGWSYLYNDEYVKAKQSFDEIPTESAFYSMSSQVSSGIDELTSLPQKSPALAGMMSAVLPGAGQVYCGRYDDAIASLLLNGLFIYGAVETYQSGNYAASSVLGFFSLMWYSGNVFSAMTSAHKFNRDIKDDKLYRLNTKYNLSFMYDKSNDAKFVNLHIRF
ncbi:tetratricopeptide repeat protein, partial [Thermodesulfobacteriota bacterium]